MPLETVVLAAYFVIIGVLSICGLHRYMMLFLYYRHRRNVPKPAGHFDDLPVVTVQLPFFNEKYVAARAIDMAVQIDYPMDRLEIQVLDDSTDETTEICRKKVLEYKLQGYDIELFHRTNRKGFKAGALREALEVSRGEFVAIFDADFVMPPSILRDMIHYFVDSKVGVVQTRWGHINRNHSLLTRLQAILLDGHLVIEQTARNRSERFFNFNGTAGMWRRQAIDDAGGWHSDTLTEDLDLSIRAQLAGYKFVFLKDIVCPAELPVDANGFKSQQHRWTKGHCQVGKKILGPILRSNATFSQKAEATLQLLMVYAYPLVVMLMLLMLPLVGMQSSRDEGWAWLAIDLPIFFAATTSVWSFYLFSQKETGDADWRTRIFQLPFVISLGIGISLSNSRAILEGVFGGCGEFVRTPKYGVGNRNDDWLSKKYRSITNLLPIVELLFGLYMTLAIATAIHAERWLSLPFLFLFQFGFLYLGGLSIIQPMLRVRQQRMAAPVEPVLAEVLPQDVEVEVESVA